MSVTFLHRMRKSYSVELTGHKYSNDRNPHVETPTEGFDGKTFPLGQRSEARIRGRIAVMYDVVGVSNVTYHSLFWPS